jgi:hypothetical protein
MASRLHQTRPDENSVIGGLQATGSEKGRIDSVNAASDPKPRILIWCFGLNLICKGLQGVTKHLESALPLQP